jgi:outer membrane immunogenic protein
MRKIHVLGIAGFLMFLLSVYPLSSQVGLKGGINISTLYQKGVDLVSVPWESAIGFTVGGFYTINVNDYFAFQPELYYSKKGGKLEGSILSVLASKSLAIHYMELPLLLKLKLPTQASINPSLFVGPYASFKLSDKGEIKVLGIELKEEFIKIKDSDFGLVFGGEIDFKISNAIIIFDIRYDLGLVNIAEPIIGIENEMKNRSLILMVGFGF